ncbi:purine-nucleoside phosphorylase [Singulisphaera acidiphila]|uniref:Purine nucleoside phosphorylase n=1 Tax=Singulisphaera acidiphila (strain ATCC BAA-1392 / DSM 18658 / VKM B-2454 / MOB10) TaxID=886293 RepID=L0DAE9_SINAD|nr:purine-nucleoside phosphorylase [Singulisphaera acidiphila]AGA25808.1 purine nucleoside phosphorylase I, inosine and guanosine-specific [Singulisphaera acidiphila DSM 18658]
MPPIELDERASEAALAIQATIPKPPKVAVVLGSGLGALANRLADRTIVPYAKIPHFPRPTVEGHEGNLVSGTVAGAPLLVFQGRFHYYEGYGLDEVTFPIRVMKRLGVRTLILTAATGGIDLSLPAGTIVCLKDHLNLIGSNPLRGPNDERVGKRFPDMTEVYSHRLRDLAFEEADKLGLNLASGVYACLPGPSYETPAEIRMLRILGADVVGMSTVPEAIVARHAGLDVLALALVTNAAAGVSGEIISHADVVEAGLKATPLIGALIEGVVQRLDAEDRQGTA